MSKRETQKADTKARVLEAAGALFAERGYANATIREIAMRAGVATGSVFTNFVSKDALLLSLLETEHEALEAAIRAAAATHAQNPLTDRIVAVVMAAVDVFQQKFDLWYAMMAASLIWEAPVEAQNQLMFQRTAAAVASVLVDARVRGEITPDVPPQVIADMMVALYRRHMRHLHFRTLPAAEARAMLEAQIRILVRGIVA
jgi:TetR/AcrR family transcriptional regulator, cholesterol catabolism regulator